MQMRKWFIDDKQPGLNVLSASIYIKKRKNETLVYVNKTLLKIVSAALHQSPGQDYNTAATSLPTYAGEVTAYHAAAVVIQILQGLNAFLINSNCPPVSWSQVLLLLDFSTIQIWHLEGGKKFFLAFTVTSFGRFANKVVNCQYLTFNYPGRFDWY